MNKIERGAWSKITLPRAWFAIVKDEFHDDDDGNDVDDKLGK